MRGGEEGRRSENLIIVNGLRKYFDDSINSSAATSLQSIAELDKIFGAPTVPPLRCMCAKNVKKSSGEPL